MSNSYSLPADSARSAPRNSRRRPRRRDIRCPLHLEKKLFSVSPKHYLYITDAGQLVLKGMSRKKADAVLSAYNKVLSLSDEWLECFWCEDCQSSTWWHVKRTAPLEYSLNKVSQELWEQASGVIRPEGNPSVSQYTRRNARFGGVQGLRQFRYL